MKKIFIIFCVQIIGIGAYAQSAVSASGGEALGSGGSSSFTIGQTFYSANDEQSGQVSEGVQQAYEIYDVTEVQNPISSAISLSAFPNPTNNFLNLLIEGDDVSGLVCTVFDVTGKQLSVKQIVSDNTIIDMQLLSPATYFVCITKEKNEVKTFKVVKN
ncbi:MAG: T9SS type A sorting domain-containing protein [Bacteroidales bacterium]|nr:T9SS type A sorting domain-containing protein [Bacteroidales bacterium]